MPFILTHTHLIQAGMPAWDVAKFKLEWPNGAEITPANLERADALGLTAHTLFAAVCPTKEMLNKWYQKPSAGKWDRLEAEKKRHEGRMKEIEKEADDSDAQHQCDLLIAALSGLVTK